MQACLNGCTFKTTRGFHLTPTRLLLLLSMLPGVMANTAASLQRLLLASMLLLEFLLFPMFPHTQLVVPSQACILSLVLMLPLDCMLIMAFTINPAYFLTQLQTLHQAFTINPAYFLTQLQTLHQAFMHTSAPMLHLALLSSQYTIKGNLNLIPTVHMKVP